MEASALRRCVGDVEAFFANHWARVPLLHLDGSADGPFSGIASLDDLDRMISSLALRSSSLRMVEDGKTLPPSAYTIPPADRSRGSEALVSPALVYERFHDGATIVLEGIHRYWEPLTDLCRELELELGHRLQVNAYITPPGSRGFAKHRDDHDVFVLQTWGSKHWKVFDASDDERILIDEVIREGASLYIPEGFPHAAMTAGDISAHLTVGILTHKGIDVLREITKLAADEPVFQERLARVDVGAEDALRTFLTQQVDEFRTWLDKLDVDRLTQRVARRLWSTSQPLLRGQLRQLANLAEVTEATMVSRRAGATFHVTVDTNVARALLHDRELELPVEAGAALVYIAGHDRFIVSDLHMLIDPASALVLARRLVREGLLEVAV